MKIYGSPASPFVRKVRVLALELGLELAVETVATATDPNLPKANPLAKIPTLVRDEGTGLFDSSVICAYLNDLARGELVPASGEARWRAATFEALADGLCDAAVWRRGELARAEGDRHVDALEKEGRRVERALDALESHAGTFAGFGVGEIAVACALGYLDFRFVAEPWREARPLLAAWYGSVAQRTSMLVTAPS